MSDVWNKRRNDEYMAISTYLESHDIARVRIGMDLMDGTENNLDRSC
jgi:hypothetical protein